MANRFTAAVVAIGVMSVIPDVRGADPIDEQLALMAERNSSYDPAPLHALGVAGLSGVLDRVFPETAGGVARPSTQAEAQQWIAELADDEFARRQAATEALAASGWPHRHLVEAAAKSNDAEVRQRAKRILADWAPRSRAQWRRHGYGFGIYVQSIKDRERTETLARRMLALLERGAPKHGEDALPKACLIVIGESGHEECCEILRPLLKHPETEVAVLVTQCIGSGRNPRFFPALLLEALGSERDEVASAALDWSTSCWDDKRRPEVYKAIRKVFLARSEPLKFQSCFALMHDYQDPEAFAYLLEQTQCGDRQRAYTAVGWVGDACNYHRTATPELLEKLSPYLVSKDDELRRRAAGSLGIYGGVEVVRRLVPMLGDSENIIVMEAAAHLLGQKDKTIVRAELQRAVKEHPDKEVRIRAEDLLGKLDRQANRP